MSPRTCRGLPGRVLRDPPGDRPAPHVHAAIEPGTISDHHAFGREGALDFRGGGELDAGAGGNRTPDGAVYDDFLRPDVGVECCGFADGERGSIDVQMSFERAVEAHILVCAELALEHNELTDVRHVRGHSVAASLNRISVIPNTVHSISASIPGIGTAVDYLAVV